MTQSNTTQGSAAPRTAHIDMFAGLATEPGAFCQPLRPAGAKLEIALESLIDSPSLDTFCILTRLRTHDDATPASFGYFWY